MGSTVQHEFQRGRAVQDREDHAVQTPIHRHKIAREARITQTFRRDRSRAQR